MKAVIGSIKGRGGMDGLEMGKLGRNSDLTDVLLFGGNTDSCFDKTAVGESVPSDGGKAPASVLTSELGLPTSASRVPDLGVFESRGKSTISLSTSSLEMNGLVTPSLICRFHSLSLTCARTTSSQEVKTNYNISTFLYRALYSLLSSSGSIILVSSLF